MASEIKRVSYTFNSILEDQGVPAYFLDLFICRDREIVVDRHESFKSRDDFYEALESVVPLFPPETGSVTSVWDQQYEVYSGGESGN